MLAGPMSLHTETAIHFAHALCGAVFTVTPQAGGAVLVECDGIGHRS